MAFAHDTEACLSHAALLVNTDPAFSGGVERLPDIEALDRLYALWQWTGRHDRTEQELIQVRRLRPRLGALWQGEEAAVVAGVNTLLREGEALPQLVNHDHWGWHLHATHAQTALATRIAVEVAMAFVDLARSGELTRLGRCAAADCAGVLVDLSKNRSRRYCDGGCANRANVAAYRRRQRATHS